MDFGGFRREFAAEAERIAPAYKAASVLAASAAGSILGAPWLGAVVGALPANLVLEAGLAPVTFGASLFLFTPEQLSGGK